MLVPIVYRHLSPLPRILVVPVTLVDQFSDSHPPVEEYAHFTVLTEHEVPRAQGCCTTNMNAFLAVVCHVERYAALSENDKCAINDNKPELIKNN